eukprot:1403029-Lingulodinium_polyedra.AAC.1
MSGWPRTPPSRLRCVPTAPCRLCRGSRRRRRCLSTRCSRGPMTTPLSATSCAATPATGAAHCARATPTMPG